MKTGHFCMRSTLVKRFILIERMCRLDVFCLALLSLRSDFVKPDVTNPEGALTAAEK